MLRVIKFWGNYSDKCEFSNCSTFYEVLPIVLDEAAGIRELLEIALSNGWDVEQTETVEVSRHWGIKLTAAIRLKETKLQNRGVYISGEIEPRVVFLGLVTIPNSKVLPLNEGTDKPVTEDQSYELINLQECSISTVCEIDGETTLVKQGWDYFHAIRFLGYSRETFEKVSGIQSGTFDDEITSCDDCGEYFYQSNGYTNAFHIVNECTLLGIKCGCYEEYCKKNIADFVNDSDKAMELDVATQLEVSGKLVHVQRFIGGMVDGRGGYFNGESTREGTPKQVLADLLKKFPKRKYVFTHDESGQFQSYFSIWQVKGNK
jgi:hypothetical protein